MAKETFDLTARMVLDSVLKEIGAMNSLILIEAEELLEKPELVQQLIRRCDEIGRELRIIQFGAEKDSGPGPPPAETPTNEPGMQM